MKTKIRTVLVVLLLVGSVVGPAGVASANTPEYNGNVTLNGQASDGSQYTYNLDSTDGVDNFSVDLTGTTNSQTKTVSGSAVDGGSTTVDIGGNLDPTTEITVAPVGSKTYNPATDETDGSVSDSDTVFGNGNWFEAGIRPDITANITQIKIKVVGTNDGFSGNIYGDVRFDTGLPDQSRNGEVITSWDPSQSTGYRTISFDDPIHVEAGQEYHFEFVSEESSGTSSYLYIGGVPGSDPWMADGSYHTVDYYPDLEIGYGGPTDSLSVTTADGQTVDYGSFSYGESKTRSVDLNRPSANLSWSTSGSQIDYQIDLTERTSTVDPQINVNGNTVGHSGTLADGSTTSLSVDTAWIENGTNNVSISTTSPSSGPGSLVDFDYSHDTSGTVHTTTLNSTTWEELYTVSNTYGSDVSNTVVTLPFSENVIDIDTVRTRTNGGSWEYPDSWELSGGYLDVNIGDVNAGETVEVKARGRKVNVENGEIDVTKPTVEGNRLSTEFEIERADSEFGIDVGETTEGSKLHYLETSSWDNSEIAEFEGGQTVRMPDAPTGGTATMTTAPIEVDVLAGDVKVEWADDATNTEPRFHVEPGDRDGDTVSYAFTGGIDGNEYSLYSETEGIVRDSGTANSLVWFEDDDSKETFQILTEGSSSIETGDGGGGFFENPSSSVSGAAERAAGIMPVVDPIWVVALVVGLIGGAIAYTERRGSPTRSTPLYRRPVVGLGVIVAGVFAVFLISPTTFTQPLQTTLGAVLPLAGILAVVGGAFWLVSLRGGNDGSGGGGGGDSTKSTSEQMVALVPLQRSNDDQTGDGATDDGWFK